MARRKMFTNRKVGKGKLDSLAKKVLEGQISTEALDAELLALGRINFPEDYGLRRLDELHKSAASKRKIGKLNSLTDKFLKGQISAEALDAELLALGHINFAFAEGYGLENRGRSAASVAARASRSRQDRNPADQSAAGRV